MIPQNADPLKEALQSDRLLSQHVIFGTIAVWLLKVATVGTTGVFTYSLLTNSLPKDASTIMVVFAAIGAFMAELCFLFSTIWIKISRNGIQTALAWSIFGISLLVLLTNTIAGAILSESKQATLGKGWLDLYLVLMPATGILCAVLVVLWSLASPEASAARRNSIAQGVIANRYEVARMRTALHDVGLNEVIDQAANRDAWQVVTRNLGIPQTQILPAPTYAYQQQANPTMQLQQVAPASPAPAPIAPATPAPIVPDPAPNMQPIDPARLLEAVKGYVANLTDRKQEPAPATKPAATFAADSGSDEPTSPEGEQQAKN